MKLLSRTTTSRNAASLMLAVWLFVLPAGFANACLLEAPDHGERQPSSESFHIAAHAAVTAHESEQSSDAPCLKACDEDITGLASSYGMDSVDPGSALLANVIWIEPAGLSARHRSGSEIQPSVSDPPSGSSTRAGRSSLLLGRPQSHCGV